MIIYTSQLRPDIFVKSQLKVLCKRVSWAEAPVLPDAFLNCIKLNQPSKRSLGAKLAASKLDPWDLGFIFDIIFALPVIPWFKDESSQLNWLLTCQSFKLMIAHF